MRTHTNFLINLLKDLNVTNVAEIGVFKGDNAFGLLENLPINQYFGIDPYERYPQFDDNLSVKNGVMAKADLEAVRIQMLKRMEPFGDRFKLIRKFSGEAAHMFEDEYFDFIFIDGNHWYDFVLEDIRVWLPKIKPFGIFAGHDYVVKENCGVIQAVSDSFEDFSFNPKAKVWWTEE